MKIYIDGQFVDKDNAKISVFDHGLLYGDGIFEGFRAYNNRVFKCKEHVDRLYMSAKAILMEIPISKEEMIEATLETCRQSNIRDGYIRLVVTRGIGNLGLNPSSCKKPTIIIIAQPLTLYPEEAYTKGLKAVVVASRRVSTSAISPAVKSLNYLNNVMAKAESLMSGAGEGIMLNEQGHVAECTSENIFVIKDGAIYTPPIYSGALDGITRKTVIALAKDLGYVLHEVPLTRYELYTADEVFFTGTAAEVVPVNEIDGRSLGPVGSHTKKFIEAYRKLTNSAGEVIFK
jgi:branched-chain amino acid aminotransferase